ncbi:MAG: transcription termination factor Rho [Elusimicrobiota bacterium]
MMNEESKGGESKGGQGQQGQGGQSQGGQGQQGQGGQSQGGGGGQHRHGGGGRNRNRHRRGGGQHHPQHHQGQQQRHNGGRDNRGGGGPRPPAAPPQRSEAEKLFMSKTPVDPYEWIQLEKGSTDPSMRAIDVLSPIGKGTRGLIVAPPKAGKTTFLKQISNAVAIANPEIKQFCLLIDERPEEVTDFKRSVPAEVFASSSDQAYERHVAVAEGMMRQAVEAASSGQDVFILLDSLTRLSRVHNQFATGSRTMSGGLDSRAMEVPRRFFGAARKLEEGGSLTILATILVDTGSKMDDIIFQEFKGTGNMELVLFRQAAEMRIFPALKVRDTGTRKEEKLFPKEMIESIYKLRRLIGGMGDLEAIKAFTEMLRVHKTNHALLAALR